MGSVLLFRGLGFTISLVTPVNRVDTIFLLGDT